MLRKNELWTQAFPERKASSALKSRNHRPLSAFHLVFFAPEHFPAWSDVSGIITLGHNYLMWVRHGSDIYWALVGCVLSKTVLFQDCTSNSDAWDQEESRAFLTKTWFHGVDVCFMLALTDSAWVRESSLGFPGTCKMCCPVYPTPQTCC